ncbi:MAG TPA: MarR family winged helix-turn-helix transcriptional regulator [Paraburkholderia sp.]|jgi:DNA-binding MarR family transcriptional regulator
MPKKPYYSVENLSCRRSIGYLVRRLHNLVVPRAEEQFAHAELSFTQWVTLMGLGEGIARTCAEVAHHLGHDTGATSRMLDQLEERGLVKRERDTIDRRVVNVALTAKGRAISKTLAPRMVDMWNETLTEFSHAEVSTLIELLTRLLARIEQEHIEAPARTRAAR